jgi:hypothetical protein
MCSSCLSRARVIIFVCVSHSISYRRRAREDARSHKVPLNLEHANAQRGEFLECSWGHVCKEVPMSTKKQWCQRYDTHRGHLCHSRGNCRPSLRWLTSLCKLYGPSTRRTSDRMDTETRKAPHLPTIFSFVTIVENLGHRYDQVMLSIRPTTVTKAGLVPSSLWVKTVCIIGLV